MICSARTHHAFVRNAQFLSLAVVVCLVMWALGDRDYFWPGWVILGTVLQLGLSARRVYGRANAG
jgi:hypothetical protein